MGREKLTLEVEGVPLIERVRDALTGCCQEVLVVGGGGVSLEGVRYITGERRGGLGPLAGMEAGLASALYPLTFVAAGDMPFLTQSMVGYLIGRLARGGVLAVVPRYHVSGRRSMAGRGPYTGFWKGLTRLSMLRRSCGGSGTPASC
jgi:molybdenum cofactor guanylyltransferase